MSYIVTTSACQPCIFFSSLLWRHCFCLSGTLWPLLPIHIVISLLPACLVSWCFSLPCVLVLQLAWCLCYSLPGVLVLQFAWCLGASVCLVSWCFSLPGVLVLHLAWCLGALICLMSFSLFPPLRYELYGSSFGMPAIFPLLFSSLGMSCNVTNSVCFVPSISSLSMI